MPNSCFKGRHLSVKQMYNVTTIRFLTRLFHRSVSCNSTMIKCSKVEDEEEYVMKVKKIIFSCPCLVTLASLDLEISNCPCSSILPLMRLINSSFMPFRVIDAALCANIYGQKTPNSLNWYHEFCSWNSFEMFFFLRTRVVLQLLTSCSSTGRQKRPKRKHFFKRITSNYSTCHLI